MSRVWGDDAVSWYERNASTGALTFGGMLKDGVNGVDGLDGARGVPSHWTEITPMSRACMTMR